jgi:exodeoxyribonuclease V beta subunit
MIESTNLEITNSEISSGITLIEASAGTGKTYSLSGIVLRLLLEGQDLQDITRMLVVTFTNAATEELTTRIRTRIKEALDFIDNKISGDELLQELCSSAPKSARKRLKEALANFDRVSIQTIHGFCKAMLESSAFETGMPFDVNFITDESQLKKQAAYDFWRKNVLTNKTMSALSIACKWSIENFTNNYIEWSRYPDTGILGRSNIDLEDIDSLFKDASESLVSNFNAEIISSEMNSLIFGKGKGDEFTGERLEDKLSSVMEFCRNPDAENISELLSFNLDYINKSLLKKSPPVEASLPFLGEVEKIQKLVNDIYKELMCRMLFEISSLSESFKQEEHSLGFDDMLSMLHYSLKESSSRENAIQSIREKFDVVLIDEFQDTDYIQLDIFLRLFKDAKIPMFFIGDPKQAIYGFRGADIFAYMTARKEAERFYTLGKNYRSEEGMVRAINKVFQKAQNAFIYENEIPFYPVEAAGQDSLSGDNQKPMQWWFINPEEGSRGKLKLTAKKKAREIILQNLSLEIRHLLNDKVSIKDSKICEGDIAVLVRTNTEAQQVKDCLAEAGIRSVISKAGNIIHSKEMTEIHLILLAVCNPKNSGYIKAALLTEILGYTTTSLLQLADNETEFLKITQHFEDASLSWKTKGFSFMFEELLENFEVNSRMLNSINGERQLTNIRHCMELLQIQILSLHLNMEGAVDWIEKAIDEEFKDESITELRMESDENAVQIVTVHKSKGLQYKIVFCPFLWNSRSGDVSSPALIHKNEKVVYDIGSKDFELNKELQRVEDLAESIRLAYVALTRAVHRCYVVWGGINGAPDSALGYLLHQPEADTSLPAEDWAREVLDYLKDHKSISRWQNELKAFTEKNSDCMDIKIIGAIDETYTDLDNKIIIENNTDTKEKLSPLECKVNNDQMQIWSMTSYTALTRKLNHLSVDVMAAITESPDHDMDPEIIQQDNEEKSENEIIFESDTFAFGRGKSAIRRAASVGVALHSIFEKSDFQLNDTDSVKAVINEELSHAGLLENDCHSFSSAPEKVMYKIFENTVSAMLPEKNFSLSDISVESRLNELGFYLPLKDFDLGELKNIFKKYGSLHIAEKYGAYLNDESVKILPGFINGFIDLIFEKDGMWYIVDWKSNYLGNKFEDYTAENILNEMVESDYVLQYHIYTLALHRYLSGRLKGYSYEKSFGGVYYAFIRATGKEGYGFFYDRPPLDMIESLQALLLEENK